MISGMNSHRKLRVWQQAADLVRKTYDLTRALPAEERFVAVPQLRRAAWSVSNNIAEGNAKRGSAELRRFLDIALGSLGEIDSMVAILPTLYDIDEMKVAEVDRLRSTVARGVCVMLRNRGRSGPAVPPSGRSTP
jgi:four helix bundle protein